MITTINNQQLLITTSRFQTYNKAIHLANCESNQHRHIITVSADWKWWRGGDGMEEGEAEVAEAGSS